jgi:hypothetical protein
MPSFERGNIERQSVLESPLVEVEKYIIKLIECRSICLSDLAGKGKHRTTSDLARSSLPK